MNSFYQANAFLINTLFSLYLYVLAIRLLAAFAQANFFNPAMQFIIKITQPLINPLRKKIPNVRGIELATVIWILLFEALKILALSLLIFGMPALVLILVTTITETLRLILSTYFYAILLQVLLSWVQQGYSPVGQLLTQIVSPIMRPLQRVIPPIGGIDITPIPALIILQFLILLLS